jgi:hypothetical protein
MTKMMASIVSGFINKIYRNDVGAMLPNTFLVSIAKLLENVPSQKTGSH